MLATMTVYGFELLAEGPERQCRELHSRLERRLTHLKWAQETMPDVADSFQPAIDRLTIQVDAMANACKRWDESTEPKRYRWDHL